MSIYEIERRFLVNMDRFLDYVNNRYTISGEKIIQSYLYEGDDFLVRHRVTKDESIITIKGKNKDGVVEEFEFDALLHPLSTIDYPTISKSRYFVPYKGFGWEVDVFDEIDLCIAEVEFDSIEKSQELTEDKFPDWILSEITGKHEYSNIHLAKML